MHVRPARPDDLPAVREIAQAYGSLEDWSARPDYLDHALACARFEVAVDERGVAGFGTVLERGGVAHLGDLFVLPGRKGEGIGSALLARLWGDARERTTLASGDARALPLYARQGMLAVTPVLYLSGPAALAARPEVAVLEAAGDALVERDARACGRRRPQDLAFLDQRPAAQGYLVGEDGYGYVRVEPTLAHLGPCGCGPRGEITAVIRSLIAVAAREAQRVLLGVPGWSPALGALLADGLRLVDRDVLMASRLDLIDAARYVPSIDLG